MWITRKNIVNIWYGRFLLVGKICEISVNKVYSFLFYQHIVENSVGNVENKFKKMGKIKVLIFFVSTKFVEKWNPFPLFQSHLSRIFLMISSTVALVFEFLAQFFSTCWIA